MSINLVVLEGRLTRDISVKTLPNGGTILSFGIAQDQGYGENKRPMFMDVELWKKDNEDLFEFIQKWFKKGKGIHIYGKLTSRTWESENGKQTRFCIRPERVEFPTLYGKMDSDTDSSAEEVKKPPLEEKKSPKKPKHSPVPPPDDQDDEDIPF